MSTFLPEDVLVQILLRLQQKSLIRFNSVSKSWAALCNNLHKYSHIFANQTYNMISNNIEPAFYSYNNLSHQALAPTFTPVPITQLIGSCNGLICLASDARIAIWNPKTRQHKLLPTPVIEDHGGFRKLGFGFDAETNDYKVVNLYLEPDGAVADPDCKYRAHVFSLSTGSWRALDALFPQHMSFRPSHSVCTYGSHSWLCSSAKHSSSASVVTFDTSSELFCETLLPDPAAEKGTSYVVLSEINRSLALVITNSNQYRLEISGFDVWVLGEVGDKDSWSKMITVAPEISLDGFYPLGFWKDFRSMFMYHSREGQLVCYDSVAQAVRVLGRANNSTQVVPYSEGLVSVIA